MLLTLGWEERPKAVSVHGAPPDIRPREPAPGVLLQTDGALHSGAARARWRVITTEGSVKL